MSKSVIILFRFFLRYFFKLQLLKYIGYQPMVDFCNICNQKLINSIYDWSIGQLICRSCDSNKNSEIQFNVQHFKLIRYLSSTHIDQIEKADDTNYKILNTIDKYLLYFLSFHIINLKYLKSIKLAI